MGGASNLKQSVMNEPSLKGVVLYLLYCSFTFLGSLKGSEDCLKGSESCRIKPIL